MISMVNDMKYRFVLVLSVLLIAATSMIVGKEDVLLRR